MFLAGTVPKIPVRLRVQLNDQGKPGSCSVVGPSYVDAFDAASCRIALAQGKFTGARDVFGRAAAGGMDLLAYWEAGRTIDAANPYIF